MAADNVFNLCRICAQDARKASMVHIFSSDGLEKKLPDKINCHLPIKVTKDDGFPQLVCQPCIKNLNTCHTLFVTCIAANEKIQLLLNNTSRVEWIPSDLDEATANLNTTESVEVTEQMPQQIATENETHKEKNEMQAMEVAQEDGEDFDWPMDDNPISPDTASVGQAADDINDNQDATNEAGTGPVSVQSPESAYAGAEIALLAVTLAVSIEDQAPTSSPKMFLVSMDKNEYGTNKARFDAASKLVKKKSIAVSTSAEAGAKCKNCQQDLATIISDLSEVTVQCTHCNQLSHQVLSTQEPSLVLQGLVSHIDKSLKEFKKNPHKNGVTYLGKYKPDCNSYMLTVQSAEAAHTSIKVKKKYDHNMFNKSDVPVSYLCAICENDTPFNRKSFTHHILEEHFGIKNVQKKLPLTCPICTKVFGTKSSLASHIAQLHDVKNREAIVCDECGKLVTKCHLATHKLTHKKKECQYCHQMLARRTWSRHKRYHTSKPTDTKDLKVSCIESLKAKVVRGAYKFPCNYCNVELERQYWMKHIAYQTICGPNIPCPQDIETEWEKLESSDSLNLQLEKAKVEWKKLILLKYKSRFTVNNPEKIKCHICYKMLTAQYYPIHMQNHSNIRPFKCFYCNKEWPAKKTLMEHIRSIHLQVGFNCQYCGKYFARKSKVNAHEAIHRGEKNFKCPYCPKYFPGVPNVKNHIKLVHEGKYKKRKRPTKQNSTATNIEPVSSEMDIIFALL